MPIRKPIREIGKQTILYGAGNALTKFAAFFLIPIYARFLPMSAVGILALLEMTEQLLAAVIPMGVMNAVWRYLPESRGSDRNRVVISAYVGSLIFGGLLLGVLALNFRLLGDILAISEQDSRILLVVLVNVFFSLGIRFMLALWQFDGKALSYIVLSTVQFVFVVLGTIYLVVQRGYGLWGVLFAKAIVYALLFLYTAFLVTKQNWSPPRLTTYSSLFKYGLPLIVLALVTPVLTVSDRFFLRVFVDLDDIGIYSINYRFGMLINMILLSPFQRGWQPMMYRLGIEEKSHEYHRDTMFYYYFAGTVIFLCISFFAKDIVGLLATQEYVVGSAIIPIVTGAYLISGFRLFFVAGAALRDRTVDLVMPGALAMISNLVLNYFLIRFYGIMGAAWATLISYTILSMAIYITSRRLVAIDWGWARILKLTSVTILVFLGTTWIQQHSATPQRGAAVGGIVVFLVIVLLIRIVGQREIKGIRSLLKFTQNER